MFLNPSISIENYRKVHENEFVINSFTIKKKYINMNLLLI